MRIHLLSDLHLECSNSQFKGYTAPSDCDVVVLAGDIHPGNLGLLWAGMAFCDKPVIYVAGNHEFYGKRCLHHHYKKMADKAKELDIHFLQNDSVIIDGVRFIGGTLWTDFNLYGNQPLAMLDANMIMNDYTQIIQDNNTNQKLTSSTILNEHKTTLNYFVDELNKEFDGKTVIVSHHAPSEISCFPEYRGHIWNMLYASHLDGLMHNYDISLWLHGHTHCSRDYMINNTRVLVNPRGYADFELNKNFDPNLIIEI